MKLKLHHVNLCSTNVPAMDEFYRTVLDLKPEPGLNDSRTPGGGYPGKVSFVTDGTTQFTMNDIAFGDGVFVAVGSKTATDGTVRRIVQTSANGTS